MVVVAVVVVSCGVCTNALHKVSLDVVLSLQ